MLYKCGFCGVVLMGELDELPRLISSHERETGHSPGKGLEVADG